MRYGHFTVTVEVWLQCRILFYVECGHFPPLWTRRHVRKVSSKQSQTEERFPKDLYKTIATQPKNEGNGDPDCNAHPTLKRPGTQGRVFHPLRMILIDFGYHFWPHWILKGSQNRSFSHKISIKKVKTMTRSGSRKNTEVAWTFNAKARGPER